MSTTSTRTSAGTSCSEAYTRSPWISPPAADGLTGITRLPCCRSRPAMRCLSRRGSGEQPTTDRRVLPRWPRGPPQRRPSPRQEGAVRHRDRSPRPGLRAPAPGRPARRNRTCTYWASPRRRRYRARSWLHAYKRLAKHGYDHRPRPQSAPWRASSCWCAHTARSPTSAWMDGTHRGVSDQHLPRTGYAIATMLGQTPQRVALLAGRRGTVRARIRRALAAGLAGPRPFTPRPGRRVDHGPRAEPDERWARALIPGAPTRADPEPSHSSNVITLPAVGEATRRVSATPSLLRRTPATSQPGGGARR